MSLVIFQKGYDGFVLDRFYPAHHLLPGLPLLGRRRSWENAAKARLVTRAGVASQHYAPDDLPQPGNRNTLVIAKALQNLLLLKRELHSLRSVLHRLAHIQRF